MVKGTHRGSVKDTADAVRLLGGAETSRRGRAATAPRRRQPPHGVGRQSPWLTPCRGRQSPSAVALFLSKKGKRVSNAASTSRCNRLGRSAVLTLDELRHITNNFSHDQLIGEGAFGKVYKGVLTNGDMIAVKRFASTITGLQDVQYETEAQHLMRLKHPNIVQLVGYCSETEMKLVRHNGTFVRAEHPERLLCLEYMPKGSLRGHLSDETSGLEWNTRYKIIKGICYGVHYLHEWWQATPVIHMDLKPANILLDDNMVPKIADFGLSRLFGEEQTRTCTRSCKGTPGYMPPEYLEKGVITKQFDIFSLGVIIIEIITGLKDYPTDEAETTSQQYIDRVFNNWRHRLRKAQGYTSQDIDYQQIKNCIQIGLLCVKFDRVKRPTINQIIEMLERSDEAYQKERETSLANDTSCESNVTTPPNPIRDASNPSGSCFRLLAIAEETFTEFLSKATGTAIDWVQMPGMEPGPDSVGIVAISHGCRGVAARACGLVNLEPTKVIEILKDRPSWFRDCRSLEVFTMFPAGNGGTVELIYMQMYAPTYLVPARDFWTLRYTTTMEDGSLVVCERSLSGSGGGPSAASAQQFVRAEMLPSGYLVRPCEGGGSIVHIVDHLDLEAWSVPEVLRPLYESSRVVAQKMTTVALRHLRQIAQETSGEVVYALGRQPAVLRTFSQRLSRGFNDASSGFNDDGWSVMGGDGIEDVVVACNSTKKIRNNNNAGIAFGAPGGIICAKASMLLQSVPPAVLVRFLREHRSEWADYNIDAYLASSLKASACSPPGLRPMRFSGGQMIMPLAHTVENEEILEVVRLEGQPLTHDEALFSRDGLLQLCTGIDEKSVGSSFQLVFAPIDEHFPDDAPLISSGFRVIPLDMKTDGVSSGRTLDLASSLDVGSAAPQASGDASPDDCNLRSVLTIAFQFPYEMHLQDSVATMARQYVRSVVSAVQRVSMAISPSQSGLNAGHSI